MHKQKYGSTAFKLPLHVSGMPVGYVINFRNAVIEFKRFVKIAAGT
jgi:hypothetical protein